MKSSLKESMDESNTRSTLNQVLICLVANIPALASGMTLGFSAIALPYMKTPNPVLHITENEASLIASCVSLSIPIGSLISGAVMERFGRRTAVIASCIPAALGWLIIALFPSFHAVLVGRLLTGLATGFCCICATVFIGESATTNLRGFLVNGTNLGFSVGIFTVYLLGYLLKENWRSVAGLCALIPLISLICVPMWMPESPVWLASRGRTNQAAKSLARLRASHYQAPSITKELQEITKSFRPSDEGYSMKQLLSSFTKPETYKPFILLNTFFFFQQITGAFVIIFYGVEIVKESGVSVDPFIITILIGLTNAIFVIVGAWASLTYGRRPCAILSGSGMTLSILILVTYFHFNLSSTSSESAIASLNSNSSSLDALESIGNYTNITSQDNVSSSTSWIPAASLLMFMLTSTIGFLSLPWSMLGEVFPTNIRGAACGLTTCITYLMNFVVLYIYPTMLSKLGRNGLFYFFGAMSLLATIFVIVFLPETQGRTLAEIENYFSGKRRSGSLEEKKSLKNKK